MMRLHLQAACQSRRRGSQGRTIWMPNILQEANAALSDKITRPHRGVNRALCNLYPRRPHHNHSVHNRNRRAANPPQTYTVHTHMSPGHLHCAGWRPMRHRFPARRPQDGYTESAAQSTCRAICRPGLKKVHAAARRRSKTACGTCLFETRMQVRCHLVQKRITRRVSSGNRTTRSSCFHCSLIAFSRWRKRLTTLRGMRR